MTRNAARSGFEAGFGCFLAAVIIGLAVLVGLFLFMAEQHPGNQ